MRKTGMYVFLRVECTTAALWQRQPLDIEVRVAARACVFRSYYVSSAPDAAGHCVPHARNLVQRLFKCIIDIDSSAPHAALDTLKSLRNACRDNKTRAEAPVHLCIPNVPQLFKKSMSIVRYFSERSATTHAQVRRR